MPGTAPTLRGGASRSGMRTSVSTTSGASRRVCSTASRPVEASPTISTVGSLSRSSTSPARIRCRRQRPVSSSMARVGQPGSEPEVPGVAVDLHRAAEQGGVLAHAYETVATTGARFSVGGDWVCHAQVQFGVGEDQLDPGGAGPVAGGVGERFLGDPVGGPVDGAGQRPPRAFDGERDGGPCPTVLADKSFEGCQPGRRLERAERGAVVVSRRAAPARTAMTLIADPAESWRSRAIRARSWATASRRPCSASCSARARRSPGRSCVLGAGGSAHRRTIPRPTAGQVQCHRHRLRRGDHRPADRRRPRRARHHGRILHRHDPGHVRCRPHPAPGAVGQAGRVRRGGVLGCAWSRRSPPSSAVRPCSAPTASRSALPEPSGLSSASPSTSPWPD